MPADSPVHQLVIIAFMIGMSGGAMSLYSAHRAMTLITIAIVLLPATAWFLLNGTLLSVGMAVGVAIFFLSAIRATKALALAQHQSFSLTHALRNSEEKHRLAMEATQDGLWDWDVITGNVYYSPSWCHIIGEDNIQNSYPTWEDRIHPDDKTRILNSLKAHLAGETSTWKEEHRLHNAEGIWIWVLGRGKVVKTDENGNPLRMIGTMTDISARKHAEVALHESIEKYQGLVEDIGDKLVVFSHELHSGKLLYVSSGFDSIFGFSREKALNHAWQDIINWLPDSTDRANNSILQLTEEEIDFIQFDMEFTHPDGKERSIRVSCHPLKDESGRVITINGVVEDITEQMSAQKRLRLAGNVLTKTQDGIVITDSNGLIVDANPASLQASGYTREEVLGSNPSIFSSGKHTPEFYAQMWSTLNTSGHWEGEVWNRRKTGEIYTERLSIDAVKDESGTLQNYVAIFHDISYFKEREDELRKIAFHDVLTGLPNRLVLNDRMQQALLQTSRNKDRIAVCYLDLDGFKPINDTHGHNTGDHVLVEVAKRLKDTLRSNDTVARIGGEEIQIKDDTGKVIDTILTEDTLNGKPAIGGFLGVTEATRDVAFAEWLHAPAMTSVTVLLMTAIMFRSWTIAMILISICYITLFAQYGLGGYMASIREWSANLAFHVQVALSIAMGLGIDYGVYMVSRLREEMQENGQNWADALSETIHSTGSAIVLSVVVLLGSFIPLMNTELANLWSISLYIGLALILDVILALTFLPQIVVWLKPKYIFQKKCDS